VESGTIKMASGEIEEKYRRNFTKTGNSPINNDSGSWEENSPSQLG